MTRIVGAVLAAVVMVGGAASATSVVVRPPSLGTVNVTPQRSALDAALSMRDTLKLGASTLEVESTHATADGGHVVRLGQRISGLPVQDGVVTVRLDAQRRVLRIQSSAVELGAVEPTPTLTGRQALDAARAAVRVPVPDTASGYGLLIVTRTGRLAWQVRVTVALPTSAPVVTIDAHTGEVLGVRDLAKHLGLGNVFASGAQAKAARQTDGTFTAEASAEVTLEHVESTIAGANLRNAAIVGMNCCPTENCDGVSPPNRLNVTVPIQGFNVPVSFPMCAEMPLAAADDNGDFLSQPASEPTGPQSPTPGPSEDNDVFAEVNAFHHASGAFAYMQSLDATFQMPEDARPLRVTTNFILPDFNEIAAMDLSQVWQEIQNGGSVTIEGFTRLGNAMYLPRGAGEQLGAAIPGFERAFDSVIFFQGPNADFGYDPAVVVHEFGHGVVAATAGLTDYTEDDQGIIDAPGAMNEGFADYWAAAYFNHPQIGEYVGDLSGEGEGSLRNLDNDFSCPSVIWGEVHQDSQHFSAALWATRVQVAGENPALRTAFDAAVLTAMSQLTPNSSFENAADAIGAELVLASTQEGLWDESAKATLDAEMTGRKVVGCERVLDLTDADSVGPVFLPPKDEGRGWTPFAPGPLQFRIQAPRGTTRLALTLEGSAGGTGGLPIPGGFGGGDAPQPKALLKADSRVHFTYGTQVGHSATDIQTFDAGDGSAVFEFDEVCASKTYYVALANQAEAPFQVTDLSVSFNVDEAALEACDAVETPDAGPTVDAGTDGSGGDTRGGCGCTAGGQLLASLAGLLFVLRRRRG